MSRLNLSRAINSSAFSQSFDIIRSTVGKLGGRQTTTPTTIPDQYGAIAMAGPDDLDRVADYETSGQVISIVTTCRVIPKSPGYRADKIVWRGNEFTVVTVDPYPQYGPGFWQVIAATDVAVPDAL